MGKTTVLRVKRRRDDPPPPSTFTLQPFALLPKSSSPLSSSRTKKQKSNEEATQLTQLMHNSTFLNKRENQLRSIIPNHISMSSSSVSTSTSTSASTTPVTTVNHNHNGLQSNDNNQALPIEKNNDSAHNTSRIKNQKAIIFRKVDGNFDDAFYCTPPASIHTLLATTSSSPPTMENSISKQNCDKKRKLDVVQVVEARLDFITSPPSPTKSTQNNEQTFTNVKHQRHQKLHQRDEDGDESGQQPYQHQTKRKRISLQMVETRTMTETEFWIAQRQQEQQQQEQQAAFASAREGQRLSSTTALRARMKRDATATTLKRRMASQPSRPERRKQTSNNVILDPLSKRIDESLRTLTAMATTQTMHQQHNSPHSPNIDSNDTSTLMASHLSLLQSNFVPITSKSKYFNWNCTNGTGTFLHCTALLNCIDIARHLCREYASILDLSVRDGGGQTVREVAETCGSNGVVEVIDHYEGIIGTHTNDSGVQNEVIGRGVGGCSESGRIRDQKVEDREGEDYVYDLFWFQGDENNDGNENNEGKEGTCNEKIKCQGDEKYSKTRDKECVGGDNDNLTGESSFTADLHNDSRWQGSGQCDAIGQKEKMVQREKSQRCSQTATESKDSPIIEPSIVSLSMSGGESQETNSKSSNKNIFDNRPITVEMHGSVGYWNESGEYVLEATKTSNAGNNEENTDMMTNDDNDDDLDSNCEGFDANDYPEEEDDIEELFGEMDHQYCNRNSSFDHGQYPDPQYGNGPFMTANMNGGGRFKTLENDSDDDENNGEQVNDFRNQPVDLNNYEGFGQHYSKRGDGFYADYSNNAGDDTEVDVYADYLGLEHTRELSSTQYDNQISNAETLYAYDPDLDG